jgi:hypothetical protein
VTWVILRWRPPWPPPKVWSAAPVNLALDPGLARIAEQTARVAGDPVLISASLDASRTAAAAGRLQDAYRISTERVSLLAVMDQSCPRAAAEIKDTYTMVCTDAIRSVTCRPR